MPEPGLQRPLADTVAALPLHRLLVRLAVVALAVVGVLLAARLIAWACTQQVSFDGAMNLEVARSFAEGHGYRRMYDDRPAFSYAIQTQAPYIVPAAGVFRLFGVGLWQAQLTNLLYLGAFALVVYALLRRWASWRWGLVAAVLCLATPGLEDIGLNGYGEIPALVWWLLGLFVLYRPGDRQPLALGRCLAAGALIGMAIVTKTVLTIGLAAVVPVLVLHELQWRPRARAIAVVAVLAAGVVLPLLAHEAWRAAALPDGMNWLGWLTEELQRVRMQAGVSAGFADTPDLLAKVATHFAVLAKSVELPAPLLALWLVVPALLVSLAWRPLGDSALRPVLLTLLAFAGLYFIWWLGVTPTEKAWYRRIFDGVIAFDLLVVLLASRLWGLRHDIPMRRRAVFAVGAGVLLLVSGWLTLARLLPGQWPADESRQLLAADLRALAELPPDAPLYGVGWFSHPKVALYAGRHIHDLTKTSPSVLAAQSTVYLLFDPLMRNAGRGGYWVNRYPHEVVAETGDLKIVALATSDSNDPFSGPIDASAALGYVRFNAGDYPYVFGFHDREGDGWRWARADVELVLRYGGESDFVIDVYTPEADRYQFPHGLAIDVWLDDCKVGVVRPAGDERRRIRLPLQGCAPQPEQLVRVRLRGDNVIRTPDDRQLSFVTHGLGFVDASKSEVVAED